MFSNIWINGVNYISVYTSENDLYMDTEQS